MKRITDLIQKQVVRKHSRALLFYLFMFAAVAVLAWFSQSLYVSLFILIWVVLLAARLMKAVHELGLIKRFTQSLQGDPNVLFRQADHVFFMEDRWLSWQDKQGVQGTYDEITMVSYARVPLRKTERLYAPCQLQINAKGNKTALIQLEKDEDAKRIMIFLKTKNPAIQFSEKLPKRTLRLEDLPEKME